MNTLTTTITNEQVNSLPLLLGIIEDMGIRTLIDEQLVPHGQWEGASVGTIISIWLCHILQERDHRLVVVRDWVGERMQTLSALLSQPLRATDCTDDRLANILTMLGDLPLRPIWTPRCCSAGCGSTACRPTASASIAPP